jgi:GDPmannose 4,6-dehydratase
VGGRDADEVGRVVESPRPRRAPPGQIVVRIDRRYFRPAEVDTLRAMPRRPRSSAGRPKCGFRSSSREMVRGPPRGQRDVLVQRHGHAVHKRNDG